MSCMPSKYISFYVWLSQGLTIPYYHLAVWVLSGRTLATTRGLEHNIQSHRLSRSFDSFIQKHKNAGFSALILILLVVARQSESILRIDSTRYGGCDYNLNENYIRFYDVSQKSDKNPASSLVLTTTFECRHTESPHRFSLFFLFFDQKFGILNWELWTNSIPIEKSIKGMQFIEFLQWSWFESVKTFN